MEKTKNSSPLLTNRKNRGIIAKIFDSGGPEMIFEEKKITLKNGTTATFRSPRVEDAEKLLDYLRAVSSETDFLMRRGCDSLPDVESERKWISDGIASPNNLKIICEIDGVVAGNCEIMMNSRFRTSHRATLAIAIRKEYWGLGIGTVMFEELEAAARAHDGVTQLELECFADNTRAQGLYKKMGFKIDYVHHDALRRADGKFTDEYGMVKKL